MAGPKKVTISLKSKTSAFNRPYGSFILEDDSTAGFIQKVNALPLANRGKYQVSLVETLVKEEDIELPTSGPSQNTEYSVNLTVVGDNARAYLSLPGLASSDSDELTALKSEIESLVRNNKVYSKDGKLIGTFKSIITTVTDATVKTQVQA